MSLLQSRYLHRSRCRLVALLLALCVLSPTGAFAQDDKAKLAQDAFDAGMSHYAEKEYGKAIAEFRKGYRVVPAGMFLYNIALSYGKLGDYDKALRYAERAGQKKDLPNKVRVRNTARIQALKVRQSAAVLAERLEPETQQSDLFGGGDGTQKDPMGGEEQQSGGLGTLTYVGAGTAVVGLGLIGGALYLGRDLDGRISELGTVDARAEYDAMRSDIESDRTVGQILLFSGVGLTAAGAGLVGWDLAGSSAEEGARITVRPKLGAPGAEVSWRW